MRTAIAATCAAAALLISSSASATELPGPLVETAWLASHMNRADVVILDVRDDIDNFSKAPNLQEKAKPGAEPVIAGHIPGARLWDFKLAREGREVNGVKLDKMVPGRDRFQTLMRDLGVNQDSAVIIVAGAQNTSSLTQGTRAYWTLKYFGHDKLALLNGGTSKWIAENRQVDYDAPVFAKGDFTVRAERKELLADAQEVESAMKEKSAQLIDGRTADFYVGQVMTKDVKAKGHIPGSRMLSHTELVNGDKTFRSGEDLKQLVASLGIDPGKPAITYCNTGHLASGAWFVMSELLGDKRAKLYDGSMHEWTKDPSRQVTRNWEMK